LCFTPVSDLGDHIPVEIESAYQIFEKSGNQLLVGGLQWQVRPGHLDGYHDVEDFLFEQMPHEIGVAPAESIPYLKGAILLVDVIFDLGCQVFIVIQLPRQPYHLAATPPVTTSNRRKPRRVDTAHHRIRFPVTTSSWWAVPTLRLRLSNH
jgi:hypothetical protein